MHSFIQFLETYWGIMGAGILPIARDTRKLLISLRSESVNEPGTYGIIGGKVDHNFSQPSEEAKREFMEETGYSGSMHLIPAYIFKDNDFQYHNFLGIIPKEFSPHLDEESSSMDWLTLDELIKIEPKHFGLKALLSHSMPLIKKFTMSG